MPLTLTDLDRDTISQITKHLDTLTLIKLLSISKYFRKLKTDYATEIAPFEECAIKHDWNGGMVAAALHYQTPLLELFIKNGAHNWTIALIYAIKCRDWDKMCLYVNKPSRIARGLYFAALEGLNDYVRYLLEQLISRGQSDWQTYSITTAAAASAGHLEVVKYLLSLRKTSALGDAFEAAAEFGHLNVVQHMLDTVPRIEQCVPIAFERAVKGNQKHIIEFLMDRGCCDWKQGLWGALEGNHKPWIDYFLQKCGDPIPESILTSALDCACSGGHMDYIPFLIEKGASTDWNIYLYAASTGGNKEVVDFLIQKGADRWKNGLEAAVEAGNFEMVKFFAEKVGNIPSDMMEEALRSVKLFDLKCIEKGLKTWEQVLAWASDEDKIEKYLKSLQATNVATN